MGQAVSFCTSCCPCPSRRKGRGAAVPRAADGKTKLLSPSPSGKSPKALGKKSKYRRPPSHLRELSGDINQVVRLVLVGGCATGKTCLLRRFLGGYFDEAGQQDYTRTLGVDFGCKTVDLGDRRVRLQMWDTGGSETYRSVVSHYLRGADGVIMCFDVSRKATLRSLRSTWAPFLDKHTPRTCRILLAGTKADCCSGAQGESAGGFQEDAKRFADAIEAQVFETSAKLGTNVDSAVLALMREVLHHREFAAQEKAEEGSSPKRKGRKRLSVALRDKLGSANEGETASLCASHDGTGQSSTQAYSSDGNATEATNSAESSSASHRHGDSSDQEGNKSKDQGDHNRAWVPFPCNIGADADDVSALGSSVDGGRSVTGGMNMPGIMGGRLSLATRRNEGLESARRVSGDSGFQEGGRYHLINQLAVASPSREARIDGAGIDAGGKGGGAEVSSDRSPLREREEKSPHRLDRGDGNTSSRETTGRNQSTLPKPGSTNISMASARPRRPIAASQSDQPPRVAVGPTVLVVDEWQRLQGGGMAKVDGVDTPMPAYCGTSTIGTREALPSRSPTEEVSSALPSETKATEMNLHVHDGGLGSSTPTSSSSSVSTVIIGDDVGYRPASPVTERG